MNILVRMNKDKKFRIRKVADSDRSWIKDFYQKRWETSRVVSRGKLYEVPALQGFIAMKAEKRIGLLCYQIKKPDCEIVTLDSLVENLGVGSALIEKAVETAQSIGCRRIWLITTNDNTHALHFYQKRGFRLVAVHRNALENSRILKPEIPPYGLDGIPLRDEIELEFIIQQ
jgi:ribosomal protein S18 acetylase RimI-like enzyme